MCEYFGNGNWVSIQFRKKMIKGLRKFLEIQLNFEENLKYQEILEISGLSGESFNLFNKFMVDRT